MKRSRAALFIWLVIFGVPLTEAQESIIIEESTPIHTIFTSDFADWPGTSGIAPLDVVARAGRIWLIWPQALVSLQRDGSTDFQTLLGYFHSRNTIEGERAWTPESGAMCSDGIWRGVDISVGEKAVLWAKDPMSGNVSERELAFSLDDPPSVQPIDTNALLVTGGSEAYLVNQRAELSLSKVLAEWQPITLSSPSGESGAVAWWDSRGAMIRLAWLSDSEPDNPKLRERILNTPFLSAETLPGFPETPPLSLSWAGGLLVCGYPDSIRIIQLTDTGPPNMQHFTGLPMPARWYRLSGSRNALLMHEPGSGRILVAAGDVVRSVPPGRNEPLLSNLLRNELLNCGDWLIAESEIKRAEMLYGWALPFVRKNRSDNPLDETWPRIEKELYKRRSLLRDRLERR